MAKSSQMSLLVPADPYSVFAALAATPVIGKLQLSGAFQEMWTVQYRAKMSMMSWGEEVTVNIFDGGNGDTSVFIYSESSLGTTLVDWGKNNENVQAIINFLLYSFPPRPNPNYGTPPVNY